MANRFVQYEDDALQELLEGKTSKNTDKATKTSKTLLKTFCDQTNLNTDLEQISAKQLDRVLQRFFAGVRKPNGELYKPTTMNSFRFGFQRYFLNRLGFDIIKAPDFSLSNTCFKNMLRTIIKSVKGDINHYPEIEPEDVKKLYSSFDLTSPTGLLEKVWFDVMFFLCRRGRENLRDMNKITFFVSRDAMLTKTITSGTLLSILTERGVFMKRIYPSVQFDHSSSIYLVFIRFSQHCDNVHEEVSKIPILFGIVPHH